jgi:hypothetical protein
MTVEQVKEAMRNGNAALADGHIWMQASHELRVEAEREVERLKAERNAVRERVLHEVFEALMAEDFAGDGIWYVLPHWTTYRGAARFLARKFGFTPQGEGPAPSAPTRPSTTDHRKGP